MLEDEMIKLLDANDVDDIMEFILDNNEGNSLVINGGVFRDFSIVRYLLFHARLICIANIDKKIEKLFAVLTPQEDSPDSSLYLVATSYDKVFISEALNLVSEIFEGRYKKVKLLSAEEASTDRKKVYANIGFGFELEIRTMNSYKAIYSKFL